jgi:pimeloyl-ACP methyl ester carboxylesterase
LAENRSFSNTLNSAWGALRHTAEILRRIPQANVEVVPGGSHAMNLENPERFNRLAEEFLRSCCFD